MKQRTLLALALLALASLLLLTGCGKLRVIQGVAGSPPAPWDLDLALVPAGDQLRILTFNTWLLWPAGPRRDLRASVIADRLCGYDIVALQEVWHKKHRDLIEEQLCDTYHVIRTDLEGDARDTGLMLLLRKCRFDHGEPVMEEFSTESGLDAMKGKGFLFVEVRVAGAPDDQPLLAIVVTHMQADDQFSLSPRRDRSSQFEQLIHRVSGERGDTGAPLLIMGDLNINALAADEQSEYIEMMEQLRALGDPRDLVQERRWASPCEQATYDTWNDASVGASKRTWQRLDYLIAFGGPEAIVCDSLSIRRFAFKADKGSNKWIGLSDHYGVEALIRLPDRGGPMSP
jgi:endonuclease/exonuclease/phosphatase family metal-dependent hydrolase